ncbi:MAG: hypothetical protein HC916_07825 [Coleofasciculaceae cyanobacterium SM2_1_6]|nr:hypothetical protein [Coleofasciculaceae cyanobacterium SM2_1_6]
MSNPTAEDFLTAYQIERNRITREAEADKKKRESESKKSIKDQIDTEVKDEVVRKFIPKLPSWISWMSPYARVLSEAEKNKARVQDAIAPKIVGDSCGVSVRSPFIKYDYISPDCIPKATPKPFQQPTPTVFFNNNSGIYRTLFNSSNVGKTFTLLWKYEGWVEDIFVKVNSGSGLYQWSAVAQSTINSWVGQISNNIIRFIPSNPTAALQPLGYFNSGNPFPWRAFLDSRVSKGNFADVPLPTDFPYFNNINYIGTHARYAYRSTLKLLAVQSFNTSLGIKRMYQVKINIRTDISIGTGNFPDYTASWDNSTNYYKQIVQDFYLMQFFRMAYSDLPNFEFAVGFAQLTDPEILGYPLVPGESPAPPPPPPPKRRCDCMTTCCPQNETDLTDIKRFQRLILLRLDIEIEGSLVAEECPPPAVPDGQPNPDNQNPIDWLIDEIVEFAVGELVSSLFGALLPGPVDDILWRAIVRAFFEDKAKDFMKDKILDVIPRSNLFSTPLTDVPQIIRPNDLTPVKGYKDADGKVRLTYKGKGLSGIINAIEALSEQQNSVLLQLCEPRVIQPTPKPDECVVIALEPDNRWNFQEITSQMSVYFIPEAEVGNYSSLTSKWRRRVIQPRDGLTWQDIEPLAHTKGEEYGKLTVTGSKRWMGGYFKDQAEAVAYFTHVATLTSLPVDPPRITTSGNPNSPAEIRLVPISAVIAKLNGSQIIETICLKP